MTRTLPTLFALLSLAACATASDDPGFVVRNAHTSGDLTSFQVAMDGERRVVAVVELDDGERVIAIGDMAGELLALAKTDGDAQIQYDVTTVDAPVVERCDDRCAPLDELTLDVLELVAADEISIDDATESWRLPASNVQKKNDATTQGVVNNMG